MEHSLLIMLLVIGLVLLRARESRQRIALLGSHLRNYQIEKLMETLAQGYQRALGETDPAREGQIWTLMRGHEASLASQFRRFTEEMAREDGEALRVSTLPLALPAADRLFPSATFDLRRVLAVHAEGIERAVANEEGRPDKGRAFLLSAEMYLMQHSCHWYCKSKTVASARLLARHKTRYEEVLAAVSPQTRQAYLRLLSGAAAEGA